MYEFHKDKERYFNYQYKTAQKFIIPFLDGELNESKPRNILEIGCAEAGVLKAFLEHGDQCFGIELMQGRIELAKKFHKEALDNGQIKFLNKNVYDINIEEDIGHKFDLIILKDVIEHIPNQEKIIPVIKSFLNPGGKIFFGFPAKSLFGCKTSILVCHRNQ
ncbi:MAG: class I SAM-dependent methyltransferase, partial [Bacteroidota bacterium]